MRRFLRENSLSIFFGVILLLALIGQAIAGHNGYNEEQRQHGGDQISLGRYLTSSAFGAAVMENWQSEYLQFLLFALATVYFLQRGSPESKEPGRQGHETDQEQKLGRYSSPKSPRWARTDGLRTAIYANSLLIAMALIFLGSWFAHSVTAWTEFNNEQLDHHGGTLSWVQFLGTSEFWEQTLQNWQSEFLAVGSFAVLTIYLRQRGSPESKPVGAPHDATGVEG